MAFGNGKVSVEGTGQFKRYIGIAPVSVLAVNPTKAELEKIYNREFDKEPEYVTTVKRDDKEVPAINLDFVLQLKDNPNYLTPEGTPIDLLTRLRITLVKEYIMGSQTGKLQVMDNYLRTAWVTKEEFEKHAIPEWKNGPARIDPAYHPVMRGEEWVLGFIQKYLGLPNVEKWEKNAQGVREFKGLIDNKAEAEAYLNDIEALFKGNVKEIKDALALQPNNKIKVVFGVRTASDGKQYQTVFPRAFATATTKNYSWLESKVKEAKDAGAFADTEFSTEALHEYTVEGTDFTQSPQPFTPATTPWG